MVSRFEIVSIGSSALGLKRLLESDKFLVTDILCLKARVTSELESVANEAGLEITPFEWIADFREVVNCFNTNIPFFIYQLDMLVPADLTSRYRFFNVHRGSLYTNRGPNPDIWPILCGHEQTALSLHKINEKIDSGTLIDSHEVDIGPTDDTATIKERLEDGLPLLIESLYQYLDGKRNGVTLDGGVYRPWVTEADFTIRPDEDSITVMDQKIRSQRQYNGAILYQDGEKYYVTEILLVNPKNAEAEQEKYCAGDTLVMNAGELSITFKVNNNPKFPPPPIRRRPTRI